MDICYECLKPMVKKCGNITLTRKGYGSYTVVNVLHFACDFCGARIILPEETERIEIEGVSLHMLATLKKKGAMSALALKEEIRSSTHILELAAKKLFKEKLINVDYTNVKMPIISLINGTEPTSFFKKIWNKLVKLNKF